ncbi:predicted protein [Enterococcus faecalis E1Sol]|uniref:DUF1642 domain-containing protein n=1 Tax=Enterococcus faecalis TaxID=1351 RepID=UPI0001B2E095|nr:DUF1642 domain-containing protein [Enterococcus faecalis]EEU76001.1 predicted protein [Enterococcus faecalis E1Sol]
MNKQELIEKLKKEQQSIKWGISDGYNAFYNGIDTAYSIAIGLAKKLDEPKKVVVPQIVADWIKYAKRQGYGFMQSYDPIYMSYPINDGLDKWIDDNEETFAHAWLDGYEVEKEPTYVISIPNNSFYKHYLARFINNNFEKPVFRHIGEEDPLFFKDKTKATVIADWVNGTVEKWEDQ